MRDEFIKVFRFSYNTILILQQDQRNKERVNQFSTDIKKPINVYASKNDLDFANTNNMLGDQFRLNMYFVKERYRKTISKSDNTRNDKVVDYVKQLECVVQQSPAHYGNNRIDKPAERLAHITNPYHRATMNGIIAELKLRNETKQRADMPPETPVSRRIIVIEHEKVQALTPESAPSIRTPGTTTPRVEKCIPIPSESTPLTRKSSLKVPMDKTSPATAKKVKIAAPPAVTPMKTLQFDDENIAPTNFAPSSNAPPPPPYVFRFCFS